MRRLFLLFAVSLAGCSAPSLPDAAVEDAGAALLSCDSPEACAVAGLDAVCRQHECRTDVPCGDDLECGLGERCRGERCLFRGCLKDGDCASNRCLTATFSCAECGSNVDCPTSRPVCDVTSHSCKGCLSDADCGSPGPAHCSPDGRCSHCLESRHCPNGLTCGAVSHVCEGVAKNSPCPAGTACAANLTCVTVGADPLCLPTCDLYAPACPTGEVCYRLTYSGATSLVFETTGPIGVCYTQQAGLRNLRESCARSAAGSNCQPNLQCVPESASVSLCRSFCDPHRAGSCPSVERCVGFAGDYTGRQYGLCLPDNGFGAACGRDPDCRGGLSCQPYDDPSNFADVSPMCQFNQGPGGGLSACAPGALTDGGVIPADRACASGACERDPLFPSGAPYFCYAACKVDADCAFGGRTGTCDGSFLLPGPFGAQGSMRGCRPSCVAESDCASYAAGASVTCRYRTAFGSAPGLRATCSPPSGAGRAGEACAVNGQCRSGLCLLEDGRGVQRQGVCTEGCQGASDCAAATTAQLPVGCGPTAVLASRGPDGVANTADDLWSTPRLCAASACATDADCRPDGGVAVCAPDVDGVGPGPGTLALRCRLPARFGVASGGAACVVDADCASGACGSPQAADAGAGKLCFQACTGATVCPGTTTCQVGGLKVRVAGLDVVVDSCAW